jgi:hypothetical protein
MSSAAAFHPVSLGEGSYQRALDSNLPVAYGVTTLSLGFKKESGTDFVRVRVTAIFSTHQPSPASAR